VEEGRLIAHPVRDRERPSNGLSTAYVMELRRLIGEDAYGSVHIADEVARRIVRAGDM
jgi:hypothetical protein